MIAPGAPSARLVRHEMALTAPELHRLAPRIVEPDAVEIAPRAVSGRWGRAGRWTIAIGPQRERVIALMRIAIADVEIRLDGLDDAEAAAFLDRFRRVFQKGGG